MEPRRGVRERENGLLDSIRFNREQKKEKQRRKYRRVRERFSAFKRDRRGVQPKGSNQKKHDKGVQPTKTKKKSWSPAAALDSIREGENGL